MLKQAYTILNRLKEITMSKITSLYYTNLFVDQVQNAKKQFLSTFVLDEKVRQPLESFVEAQRTYTKELNRVADEIFNYGIVASKNAYDQVAKTVKV